MSIVSVKMKPVSTQVNEKEGLIKTEVSAEVLGQRFFIKICVLQGALAVVLIP